MSEQRGSARRRAWCFWIALGWVASAAVTGMAQPGSQAPQTLLQASPYGDPKASKVGDILTVAIVERASASNTSRVSTSHEASFDNNAQAGTGVLSFLPDFGMSASSSRDQQGVGQQTREGRLNARMAVTVTEVRPNGDLVVSGSRVIETNGEKETLQLTGVVRPIDIGPGNVVMSTHIADAQIAYSGKGTLAKGSKPNILVRLFSWLF